MQSNQCWYRHLHASSLFILMLIPLTLSAADDAVELAWKKLNGESTAQAENLFKQALVNDAKNYRACVGLSYIHSMRHDYDAAWQYYAQALRLSENPSALQYALITSPIVLRNLAKGNSELIEIMEKVQDADDKSGTLRAMVQERLGEHYQGLNNISKSRKAFASLNAITEWNLIGPFENLSGSGMIKEYAPEREIDFNGKYDARFGSFAHWFAPQNHRADKWIDFERFFVSGSGVFYALSYVYSPAKQSVTFRVGTSGAFKAFLNDEQLMQSEDEFNNDLDTYVCETELQSGWNKVLMKVGSWEISRCNFLVRIVDASGKAIKGLKADTAVHPYASRPKAQVRILGNSFEQYFEKLIADHPDHYENYLLLADCYLRNDKGEQAELTLRSLLKRSPNSLPGLDKMMEAYIRNEKRDLVVTTLEKIWKIDSTLVSPIDYKFREAIRNKNYEEAERLLNAYEKYSPDESDAIQLKLQLLVARNNSSTALELLKSAYEKYPTNIDFASGMAYILVQAKRSYSDALELWQRVLKVHYTNDVLARIADLHSELGEFSRWEEYRNKMLELANYPPGFYHSMAKTYFAREMYDKAEENMRIALASCPGASEYYDMLGDIARKRGDNTTALKHYRESLKRYPGDYKTRETIRDIEGKKPVWANFPTNNVDSLIKSAPEPKDYPDEESAILLNDVKHIVYPEGASESRNEFLVRILKQEGIDDWKEVNLGSNVVIEKAVSVKPGGSELRADTKGGEIVFKALQQGDFIYLRWRENAVSIDKFIRHFNITNYFDGRIPNKLVKLSVLSPKSLKLNFRANNMKQEPRTKECDDGVIYEWRMDNVSAVKVEASMPSREVTAKYIEVSSIDSWQFVSDWYREVTHSKPKATYEIREKTEELLGDASKLNEEEIIRRVYQFITDSIRYSYVPFRQSGGTPQKARDVLITRIGDCKDVATLGISMLGLAGIPAEYVLVKTNTSKLERQLPSRDFDHVIVRTNGKSGVRYLDFTASNYPVGSVPAPDVDAFSLRIAEGIKDAQHLSRSSFAPNISVINANASLNEDGDLSVQRESWYSGGLGAVMRYAFRSRGKTDNEKAITEDLSKMFSNVKLKSLEFSNLDTLSNRMSVRESFDAPRYGSDIGSFKIIKVPWFNALELDEAFSYTSRTYPLEFDLGFDSSHEDIRITIPEGYEPVELKPLVTRSSTLADYSVTYSFANRLLRAERKLVIKNRYVLPQEYESIKEFYNSVVKEDTKQILLTKAPPKKEPKGRKK